MAVAFLCSLVYLLEFYSKFAVIGISSRSQHFLKLGDVVSNTAFLQTISATHTSLLTAFLSGQPGISWHQKGKPFSILLEQEMMGWQWHQLDHMQIICTSHQTDNHAITSPLSFFTCRMPFLPPNQQCQALKANCKGCLHIKNSRSEPLSAP